MFFRDVLIRSLMAATLCFCCRGVASAQTATPPAPAKPNAPLVMNAGDILSGQLTAIKTRGKGKGKRVATYQLVSQPRRLPAPGGLCNLETGPETFQIVAEGEAQAAQLKKSIGKVVALKVDRVMCAEEAGVMSEAVVTKWSLVAAP